MKVYLSFFYPLLVVFFGFFFFFNTSIAFATSHGTCKVIKSGLVGYCGGSTNICGPIKYLNDNCDNTGKTKTGTNCCKLIPGNYDYCSGTLNTTGAILAGPGDCTNVPYEWLCCTNPTPTPTPTPTATPTPTSN